MTDLNEELNRASQAQDVLDNPLVQEFLTKARENIRREFEFSKANDREGREEAWRMLKVLNEFERHFISIIETGKMAEKQLSMQEKVRNLFSSRF